MRPAHCTTGLSPPVTDRPPAGGAPAGSAPASGCGGGAAGRATDKPETALEPAGGGGGGAGGAAACEEGMLTRKGPGDGAAATAGGGFGMRMSFWHEGHFVCIPAHSGPHEMCCEQWGHENFNSLITQLAYPGNTRVF